MYTQQKLQVRWGNSISDKFSVQNGVKQGGVLSPILFAIYIDGLLTRLKKSGVGCHMGHHFVGCLAFADDLTLMAPTIEALKRLVSIYEDYANEFHVLFSGKKSQFLIFKGRGCSAGDEYVTVNGSALPNVNSAIHLGHKVSTVNNDSLVSDAICKFWKSFNLFMADFGHIHAFAKCKLFKQYCCSFYGAPLWFLGSNRVTDLYVVWRKAVRVVWNIPYMTHTYVLPLLSECLPFDKAMEKRFVKFFQVCLQGKSPLLKTVAQLAMYNPFSNSGRNYVEIVNKYGMSNDFKPNVICVDWYANLSFEEKANANVLKDMIDIRDGFKKCDILNNSDIQDIIDNICFN